MAARFLASLHDLARRPDIVIVGSGVAGLATAFFAGRKGLSVLVIDRLPVPAALTSRRSGEGVRAQWELPHNIEIARNSIDIYRRFGEVLGDDRQTASYNGVGYFYGSRTAAGAAHLAGRVARQQAAGLDDVVYLQPDAIHRRFPLIAPDVAGAAFRQGDGTVIVSDVLRGYLQTMEADILLGVDYLSAAPGASGVRIETSAGAIDAGAMVLADGARLPISARKLGLDLPVRTARSTLLFVKTPLIPATHTAVVDTDIGSFWRPNADGARMTSSFRGTLFVEDGLDDPVPDPDYLAYAIATVSPMVPRWAKIAPYIEDPYLRTGTFAVSADGAPMIGAAPGLQNVYIQGAYAGHGIMMSPDGGRRLADMLAAGNEPANNPFSPSRFSGPVAPTPEPMTIHVKSDQKESA